MLLRIVVKGGRFGWPGNPGSYSCSQSFTVQIKPSYVVKPGDVNELQEIVKRVNQTKTPLVPVSSGPPRFHGGTVAVW